MRVQKALGDRLGEDVFLLSVTLDPETDTPDVLADYAEACGAGPGWTFLTGKLDDIEHLRRRLGFYDPDPIVDADKTQHAGLVMFGNDATGRWAAIPGLVRPDYLVRSLLRVIDS